MNASAIKIYLKRQRSSLICARDKLRDRKQTNIVNHFLNLHNDISSFKLLIPKY